VTYSSLPALAERGEDGRFDRELPRGSQWGAVELRDVEAIDRVAFARRHVRSDDLNPVVEQRARDDQEETRVVDRFHQQERRAVAPVPLEAYARRGVGGAPGVREADRAVERRLPIDEGLERLADANDVARAHGGRRAFSPGERESPHPDEVDRLDAAVGALAAEGLGRDDVEVMGHEGRADPRQEAGAVVGGEHDRGDAVRELSPVLDVGGARAATKHDGSVLVLRVFVEGAPVRDGHRLDEREDERVVREPQLARQRVDLRDRRF
jgi:hypothetical protein